MQSQTFVAEFQLHKVNCVYFLSVYGWTTFGCNDFSLRKLKNKLILSCNLHISLISRVDLTLAAAPYSTLCTEPCTNDSLL